MAHHVEPMEIDTEGDFDNKENTYHHSNVLPRTPCTEKGYEELDVSELNMKLRYSITPAASPMSKSMSHCRDSRYNTSTDESLNNTVINENENNLTRSLNSTLSKTDVSVRALPLQAMPSDKDSNRNSTVLCSLDTTVTKDVTITVSNENELDCLSIPSSSSSMTHTPEATTPTKEIPKNDGGSPIMRGLKSVLSMFRSSQSPIPPGEADNNPGTVDVSLPDLKPQAIASTPINQKGKESSLSRRNSPHKESIVFNEDLEKELQWNDDSAIVFSTEKIPIHKLFFQDKPYTSKTDGICLTKKEEEVNSSVEYMDISYNDLSIRDKTLNGTVNKSKANDIAESDGEFVDCETTFTQKESQPQTDEEKAINNISNKQYVQEFTAEKNATIYPVMDATQDIINLIDSTQFTGEVIEDEKQLDFSSTDIVNQLSELINASEGNLTNKTSAGPSINESLMKANLCTQPSVQPEAVESPITDLKVPINTSNVTSDEIAEHVSIEQNSTFVLANVPDILNLHIDPPNAEAVAVEVSTLLTDETTYQMANYGEVKTDAITEINNEKGAFLVSTVDMSLPTEVDFARTHDNRLELSQCTEVQDKTVPNNETSFNVLMSTLDKITTESSSEEPILHDDSTNSEIPCPSSILASDGSLPQFDNINIVNVKSFPHEAITDVPNPVLPLTIEKPDIISSVDCSEPLTTNEDARNSSMADNNRDINLVARVTEEKMEISLIEQNTTKLHEISVMDVSILVESSPDEPKSSEALYPVEQSPIAEINKPTPSIALALDAISENHNIKENIVAKVAINEKLSSKSESETLKDINSSLEKLKSINSKNLNIAGTDSAVLNQMLVISNQEISNDISNTNKTRNNVSDVVDTIDVTTTIRDRDVIVQRVNEPNSNASVSAEMSQIANISGVHDLVKENVDRNIHETEDAQNSKKLEEKIDEEIVLSGSNSPFVSVSAEDHFDSAVKKDDVKETENVFSNEQNNYLAPPDSPKIVSKGYNFDFDDMDSMNPFTTKTKIRMSPPPAESQNTSLQTLNKNENINRRKSMPVKKHALKTNKKFNATFDTSKSTSSKLAESKIDDRSDNYLKTLTDIKKQDSLCEQNKTADRVDTSPAKDITLDVAVPDVTDQNKKSVQTIDCDSNTVTTEKFDDIVSKPLKTSTMIDADECDITDQNEANTKPINTIPDNDIPMKLGDTVSGPLKTSTVIEDIDSSDSCKSFLKSDNNTSSSEQSTYYSAGTSSVECEPKKVFDVPEINDQDFNPFATKSKIRQTPPPNSDMVNPFATKCQIKSSPETSLVISQDDPNATVIIDAENKTEVASNNLSDRSSASYTSDDKDVTVQEVNTEDEDTMEGPFLEADDDTECEKMAQLIDGKNDIVDFNNKNAQVVDDNTEAGEMFIDAEAFEFLMNQNKADEVAYSGKESLFLKFDPLFARRVTSEGVVNALSELKKRQSTPRKTPKQKELISFEKPIAGPSDLNVTHEVPSAVETHDDMNVIIPKPMMVVPPAVNPVATPKKYATPNRTNRLSMTFTSPAMAVIDRLLSLSCSSPPAGLDATVTHISREHNEADQALTQLRELLAEKEIHVYNLRCESKELKDRLFTLETQMKSLETESAERLKKVNELNENLAEKTKTNKSMAAVVEEYERTIASLISETEQDKKRYAEERNQLIRERDEQTTHLASMEVSFNDLHSKYEKSKQVIINYKTNEEAYKNSLTEFEDNLAKMHTNYELLKQHATSKLNHANQELEKLNKAHESEVLKLNAMIKRKDLHITSLEESLAQKSKANEELTAICDELINKVG